MHYTNYGKFPVGFLLIKKKISYKMTKPLKPLWLHACWVIMTDWSTYQSDMLKVRKWHFYEHLLQYILS